MKNKNIGIYLITERATRKDVYVGQGIVYDRWKKHRSKYPEDRFDYRILLECPRCDLNFWEQHYIRALKTHWTEGGENQNWGGQFWPRPEEPISPATRDKIAAANKGQVPHNKGMPCSPATRDKIAASKKGSVSPNKGKTRSEEARAKQSEAMKGRVFSEEHKAKLRGRVQSEEEKAKRSAAAKARAALKRATKATPPVDELLGPDCPSATTDNLTQ
jgi:hypothetical protein